MRARRYDLLVIGLGAVLAALAILSDAPFAALRVIAAPALIFVLPGYALVELLFPRRQLGPTERTLYVVGLSLAVTVVGGLVLDLTPLGLQTVNWVLWLSGVTVVASLLAVARATEPSAAAAPRLVLGLRQGALLGLAAVFALLALYVSYSGATQLATARATQLWLLPPEAGTPGELRVGVENQEAGPRTYRLLVRSGDRILQEWSAIGLDPGERWQEGVPVTASQLRSGPVEALLFVQGSSTVYRRAVLRQNTQASLPLGVVEPVDQVSSAAG